ncbi:hypothetical protein PCANC_11519 [Puccinia coronata f. sp. avenae]|nr:hypothetical protein PCANC_11519 [Puccinia coronata f. sp. avenae]
MSENEATNDIHSEDEEDAPSEDEEDSPSEDEEEEDETDHWPIPVTDDTKSLTLPISIIKLNDEELSALIKCRATERYGDEAKEIQVSAVVKPVKRRNTFVLAGTGFGKTRIAEMYWDLFPKNKKAIVLSLNPLDTLGDNQ